VKERFCIWIFSLLVLTSCVGPGKSIAFDKSKSGGLYEGSDAGIELRFRKDGQKMRVDTATFIPFVEFKSIRKDKANYASPFVLLIALNEHGTRLFQEMTERNVQKRIAFVIGDSIISAPIVQQELTNGLVQMTLSDEQELEEIINFLAK